MAWRLAILGSGSDHGALRRWAGRTVAAGLAAAVWWVIAAAGRRRDRSEW